MPATRIRRERSGASDRSATAQLGPLRRGRVFLRREAYRAAILTFPIGTSLKMLSKTWQYAAPLPAGLRRLRGLVASANRRVRGRTTSKQEGDTDRIARPGGAGSQLHAHSGKHTRAHLGVVDLKQVVEPSDQFWTKMGQLVGRRHEVRVHIPVRLSPPAMVELWWDGRRWGGRSAAAALTSERARLKKRGVA